ncbi:hypothetical protein ACFWN7_01990 [Agromyces sp. NPDC058484]|uniref:hypothetical protein n=1 Tax=Agromyces sp. NPDC058484 TaxID=3346524 RepID=UPI0036586307
MDNYDEHERPNGWVEYERRLVATWAWLKARLDTKYPDAHGTPKLLRRWTMGDWGNWPSSTTPLLGDGGPGSIDYPEGPETITLFMGLLRTVVTEELVEALAYELAAVRADRLGVEHVVDEDQSEEAESGGVGS